MDDEVGSVSPAEEHLQLYCLRWSNYQNNITTVFQELLENQSFVDVTLACTDHTVKAHKIILSAFSSYFKKVLLENPCDHPTIILPAQIQYTDLTAIIEFLYKGEMDVTEDELQSVLRTAEILRIKGLCDINETNSEKDLSKKRRQSSVGSEQEILSTTPPEYHQSPTRHKRTKLKPKKSRVPTNRLPVQYGEEESDLSDNGNSYIILEKKLLSAKHKKTKNMASLGMGMNGVLMGVPLGGYLDFAPEPPAPSATPVSVTEHVDLQCPPSNDTRDLSNICVLDSTPNGEVRIKFETLRSLAPSDGLNLNNHHMSLHTIHQLDPVQSSIEQHNNSISSSRNSISNSIDNKSTNDDQDHQMIDDDQTVAIKQESNSQNMIITPEIVSLMSSTQMDIYGSDTSEDTKIFANNDSPTNQQSDAAKVPKTWTQEDMESALDALRNHNMSLTKASITFGIPSTTLWQRAHRLGIDTPKKEGPTKTWSEDSLNSALEALRTGQISANKASKAYGIPSSTLYKIARREGIRLAAPFNAAPTTWTQEDLERALEAIRAGHTSVQKASTEFGIPTGTLYGRCKREGIELSRSNPTPWSEDAMMDALESVRVGQMSINQAAIHYNLPYSSLYGRFKRGKYEAGSVDNMNSSQLDQSPDNSRNFQYSPTGPATIQHQIHPTHQSIVVTSPSLLHHHQQQQHPSNHHNIMYHHVQTLHPSMQHERS